MQFSGGCSAGSTGVWVLQALLMQRYSYRQFRYPPDPVWGSCGLD